MAISADTTLSHDHFGDILINADGVTLDCAGNGGNGSGLHDSDGNMPVGNSAEDNAGAGFHLAIVAGLGILGSRLPTLALAEAADADAAQDLKRSCH